MKQQVNYALLCDQLSALIDGIPYEVANLANASALLWETLEGINWAGFYKMTDGRLVLGPFQGKTACIMIPVGRGVCGTAVAENRTQLVPDVHSSPVTSPATAPPIPRSWCPFASMAGSGAFWTSTAPILTGFLPKIRRVWNNS